MNMSSKVVAVIAFCLIAMRCNKQNTSAAISLRDTKEVASENEAEISNYLKTHFYNYESFQKPTSNFDYKVQIDTISGSTVGKTPLSEQVQTRVVTINNVDHKIYHIVVREGSGDFSKFSDSILVRYKGENLKRKVFDYSNFPVWLDVQSLVRGWRHLIPKFRVGLQRPKESDSGNLVFGNDYGIGIMIFPSRLGYFSRVVSNTGTYAPLVFSFDLLARHPSDHDGDGILSVEEDLNKNEDLDDDDTDGDGLPNYKDSDDDGDGTSTKDEYDVNKDGIVDDYDKDGIPDYLDNK